MTANDVFGILYPIVKGLTSGIKKVEIDPTDNFKLLFTLADSSNTQFRVSLPNSVNNPALLNRIGVDADGFLLLDGKRISDFEDEQVELLNKFSTTTEGKLQWDGKSIGGDGEGGTCDWTTNITVGGLNANTNVDGMSTVDVLRMITRKYANARCTVTWSPTKDIYEIGQTIDIDVRTSAFVNGDYPCSKVALYQGATKLEEKDVTSTTVDFTQLTGVGTTTTYKVVLTDGNGATTEPSKKTYTFVNAMYKGVVADGTTLDETAITGLNKLVEVKGNKTIAYTTTGLQTVVFAYPASYGASLSAIVNQNNYNVTANFTKSNVTVSGVSYVVYSLSGVNVNNFKYTFKF